MTEERLRDLLHETVADVGSPDLVEDAWRRAGRVRRRQQVVTVGATLVVAAVAATGVRVLTGPREPQPVQPPSHSVSHGSPTTPAPTQPTGTTAPPDATFHGDPLWWAPGQVAALPALEDPPLAEPVDLGVPASDATLEPLDRAVAAFADVGFELGSTDSAVRLVGPDGEQRDLDVSGLSELASNGPFRTSAVTETMLSPDGRTLAFPQSDHVMLFDIPSGEWSRLDVAAPAGLRWADAASLYLPWAGNSAGAEGQGRVVGLDGRRLGQASLTDVVRPDFELDSVLRVGAWRAASGVAAQAYAGGLTGLPGRDGVDERQTLVVVRGSGRSALLTLPSAGGSVSQLADWLDPTTLVYARVDGTTAHLVAWPLETRDFALAGTITGLRPRGLFVGSYAFGA